MKYLRITLLVTIWTIMSFTFVGIAQDKEESVILNERWITRTGDKFVLTVSQEQASHSMWNPNQGSFPYSVNNAIGVAVEASHEFAGFENARIARFSLVTSHHNNFFTYFHIEFENKKVEKLPIIVLLNGETILPQKDEAE